MEYMVTSKDSREVIADGFLYKHTCVMMSADPGAGKSTVSTQVAVELAAGLPVFGTFYVPRPCKILYIQTERSLLEFVERLQAISEIYPIVSDNIYVTDEYQKLNITRHADLEILLNAIERDCKDADVIFVDPIYSMVPGGLKDEGRATIFNNAMNLIQKITGGALYYNHHTIKKQYNSSSGTEIERDDPFYGSQWLKAHVTGSFYIKKHEKGVKLLCKKDNYGILHKNIELEYDAETELCSVPKDEIPAVERVREFLKLRKLRGEEFSFSDILAETKLCTRTVRKILVHTTIKDTIFTVSTRKNRHIYKMKEG